MNDKIFIAFVLVVSLTLSFGATVRSYREKDSWLYSLFFVVLYFIALYVQIGAM